MTDTMAFAPEYDVPLDYMRRTRDYYLALGYDNPTAGRTTSMRRSSR